MDLERILERAADAGATRAGSLLVRLPMETADLFETGCADRSRIGGPCPEPDPPVPRGRLNDPDSGPG